LFKRPLTAQKQILAAGHIHVSIEKTGVFLVTLLLLLIYSC